MYEPPYTITDPILSAMAAISEKVGHLEGSRLLETRPILRHNNRIRSIHSSLKIEANSLSLDEVRGVLNGRAVLGPASEIQEVKNAFAAYEQIGAFDPYRLQDLLRLHGVMTAEVVDESGMFRTGNEGVFNGDRCIFVAPPPERVPVLMEDLFAWIKQSRHRLHPLILSCVFHYEFVFIHPFKDGNGRMARLWQTALLTQWNPIFQYLPIESSIERYVQDYYAAIDACNHAGNSTAFIEFMLSQIDGTLSEVLDRIKAESELPEPLERLLASMEHGVPYTARALMQALGLSSRDGFRRNYLSPALAAGLIRMEFPHKPNSRNQRYIRV